MANAMVAASALALTPKIWYKLTICFPLFEFSPQYTEHLRHLNRQSNFRQDGWYVCYFFNAACK